MLRMLFKCVFYGLMSGIAKEGFKCIKRMGEAHNEDKSELIPIGEHGFKMSLYAIAGLVVRDIGTIVGVIPPPVVKAIVRTTPAIKTSGNILVKLFPWAM